jgi:hypothetical protein
MANAHKQQARRERAKAKLSAIKAKVRPKPKQHHAEADRQADRLRRFLIAYPMFSAQFDTWIEDRKEQVRQGQAGS